jgi:hypothetical protein
MFHYLSMSGTSTSTESTLVHLLRAPDCNVQKIFEVTVRKSGVFQALEELTDKYDVPVQIFDLPSTKDFQKAAMNGTNMLVDIMHFTSSQESALVNKHGLRKLKNDEDGKIEGFRLRCRDMLFYFWEKATKKDRTVAPTFSTFLGNVVMANLRGPMTPYNGKGQPYDGVNEKPISKRSRDYDKWKRLERELFTFQLKLLCIIGQHYNVKLSLLLTGRGTGAKRGVGGSHMAYLEDAINSLTDDERNQIVHVPRQASQHAVCFLLEKRWLAPSVDECKLTESLYLEAAQSAKIVAERVRASSLPFAQALCDPDVSILLLMCL